MVKIEVRDDLYRVLKEYCEITGVNMHSFVHKAMSFELQSEIDNLIVFLDNYEDKDRILRLQDRSRNLYIF